MLAVLFDFGFDDRPRTNEAHLAAEDVPQLRQFVEAGLADEVADPGDPGIFLQLVIGFPFGPEGGIFREQFLQHLVGVGNHAAELPGAEAATMAADPFLRIEDRTGRAEANGCGDEQQERRRQQHADA